MRTLPSAAMLAKKQHSLGTLDPAAAAANAAAPKVMLRTIACQEHQGNVRNSCSGDATKSILEKAADKHTDMQNNT